MRVSDDIRAAAARVRSPIQRETIEVALLRYQAGWLRRRIAAEAFVSTSTIDGWVSQSGITTRGPGNPREARVDRDYLDKVIESYKRTQSLARTAEEVGRGESVVNRLIRTHAPDLLRPVGGPADPAPDGWETPQAYSIRHQRTINGVYDALKAGRIPGARRFPAPRSRLGQRWLIPEGTPDVLRAHRGRKKTTDELAARREARAAAPETEYLDALPLVQWVVADRRSVPDLASGDPIVERALRRLLSGEQTSVGVGFADRLLLPLGVRLEDVWDDMDRSLAEGRRLRDAIKESQVARLQRGRRTQAESRERKAA